MMIHLTQSRTLLKKTGVDFVKYSVDRIEEGFAVCEDENGVFVNFELALLPYGIREGDILLQDENGFAVLKDETQERREKLAKLQKSIFTKKNG